ncbi:MAG: DUF366 family protein [Pseudobdellovibrionaceae bacterium]
MKSRFLTVSEKYDGSQLVSLRNYLQHGILGDSVVAWIGACDVAVDHMVDGEDLVAGAEICGGSMLHFIVEKFDCTLLAAVGLQRLLASIVRDELAVSGAQGLVREGDDIYSADRRKLSISIATQSPVSSLIHFAVNVTNDGTPVKTLSLSDLKVEPRVFAEKIMAQFCDEVDSIVEATHKVRWVK